MIINRFISQLTLLQFKNEKQLIVCKAETEKNLGGGFQHFFKYLDTEHLSFLSIIYVKYFYFKTFRGEGGPDPWTHQLRP